MRTLTRTPIEDMIDASSILVVLLITIPGLLIPLHVIHRMFGVLRDRHRASMDRVFAGGAMMVMVALMLLAVYAAQEISGILNRIA